MFLGVFRCAKNFESCHIFCRQTALATNVLNVIFVKGFHLSSSPDTCDHITLLFSSGINCLFVIPYEKIHQYSHISGCFSFEFSNLAFKIVQITFWCWRIQRAIFPIFPRFYNLILLNILSSITSRNFEELAAKVQR